MMQVARGWLEEHLPWLLVVLGGLMVAAASGALWVGYQQAQGAQRLCASLESSIRQIDVRIDSSPTYRNRPAALKAAHDANADIVATLNCPGLP